MSVCEFLIIRLQFHVLNTFFLFTQSEGERERELRAKYRSLLSSALEIETEKKGKKEIRAYFLLCRQLVCCVNDIEGS